MRSQSLKIKTMSDQLTTITQKTSVSVALVIVIITGIIANVGMMYSLRETVTLVQHDVTYTNKSLSELKTSLSRLTDDTRSDIREVRETMVSLSDRLNSALSRISELEGER